MNLLLVDDHALVREGLRALLANLRPGVAIHEAANVEGAIDECRTTQFRMVLLDLGLTETSGIDTLDAFREAVPEVPVVVLSGDQDTRHIRTAIDHGAVGFVPKAHTSQLMIAALQFVLSGGIYLPPNVLSEQVDDMAPVTQAMSRLSPRQQEVAQLLLKGSPNKVIARQLGVSEGTVKAHVSAIFQIMGARNRVDAVIIAAKSGMRVI